MLRKRGCERRIVVDADEKSRIVAELKKWKADGGLEKSLLPSAGKIEVTKSYKKIKRPWRC